MNAKKWRFFEIENNRHMESLFNMTLSLGLDSHLQSLLLFSSYKKLRLNAFGKYVAIR